LDLSWRLPFLALCLLLAALLSHRPALAQAGSPDQVSGPLLYSISLEETQSLLKEVGFALVQAPEPHRWVLRSSGGHTLLMTFVGCKEERCEGVRVRAVWSLGERPLALAAVRSFELSVPIAHVSVRVGPQGKYLLVGRDIWMLPGRTAANVAAQLAHCDILASSMTEHLRAKDPGISEFWEATTPQ
jgi:hypothetical protein